jgi:hypothetical protein
MIFINSPVTRPTIEDPTTFDPFAVVASNLALKANSPAGMIAIKPPSNEDMAEESKPNGLPFTDQAQAKQESSVTSA